MNRKIKLICACGAAIAQSTMMQMRLEDEFKKRNIPVQIEKCIFSEVPGKVDTFKPDFVFGAGNLPYKIDVPVYNGFPIITGIGLDEMINSFFVEVDKLLSNEA
ncbi:MAG: PTS sugar transporter subunit IIB [Eubacteriales bacterium]